MKDLKKNMNYLFIMVNLDITRMGREGVGAM
jgi:hypothetical protein